MGGTGISVLAGYLGVVHRLRASDKANASTSGDILLPTLSALLLCSTAPLLCSVDPAVGLKATI